MDNLIDNLGCADIYIYAMVGWSYDIELQNFAVILLDKGCKYDLPVLCICTVMQCIHVMIYEFCLQMTEE